MFEDGGSDRLLERLVFARAVAQTLEIVEVQDLGPRLPVHPGDGLAVDEQLDLVRPLEEVGHDARVATDGHIERHAALGDAGVGAALLREGIGREQEARDEREHGDDGPKAGSGIGDDVGFHLRCFVFCVLVFCIGLKSLTSEEQRPASDR